MKCLCITIYRMHLALEDVSWFATGASPVARNTEPV